MKNGNKRWIGITILALFPAIMMAQNPDTARRTRHEFSVQQAVDYATKNNAAVKNALLDVRMQEQVNREVTSNAFPNISGNLSTTYNPNVATQVIPNFIGPATYQVLVDEGVQGSGGPITMPDNFGFIAAQFGTKYSANAGVSLSQILFDGQVFVGLQARKTTIDFASKKVELTEEMIKTNIHKIYNQLIVGKLRISLLDSNISTTQKLLRDTRVLFDNGFAEKLDVDRINVQIVNLQTDRTRAINQLSNGYYGLKVLMGMPIADELVLTDTLDDQKIREGILESSIYKYEDRKEYQLADLGLRLNEFNVRRYKLSQIPTVSLNGNYAKNAQRNRWDFFGRGPWYTISSVSLNINVPIFRGFYTKAKIEQARIDLQKTQNSIDSLKLSIDSDVATSINNFNSAISTVDAQKTNMQLAQNVYDQTRTKYELGVGSQLEINTAQRDLLQAQTNYINALYDAVVARIDLLRATGKL